MAERPTPDTALRSRSADVLPTTHSASSSPARGRETRTALLQKLRPPPLVHAWDFWYEKPQYSHDHDHAHPSRSTTPPASTNSAATTANGSAPASSHLSLPQPVTTPHGTLLTPLHSVTDLKHFWTLFNNFSFSTLPAHTSVHLFHNTVTPTWEDTRNTAGGSWTFRIPRASAGAVFQQLALLAIGEKLQEAVYQEGKTVFRDDICGVSLSVKGAERCSVSVWNRDAGNEVGKERLSEVVVEGCEGISEGACYYRGLCGVQSWSQEVLRPKPNVLIAVQERSRKVGEVVQDVGKQCEMVRKGLEDVRVKNAEMDGKLETEIDRKEAEVEAGVRPTPNVERPILDTDELGPSKWASSTS